MSLYGHYAFCSKIDLTLWCITTMHRVSLCCILNSSKSKGKSIPNEPPRMATHSTTKAQVEENIPNNHQPRIERADHGNPTEVPQIVIHHTSPESIVKDASPEPYHLHPFYRSQKYDSHVGKKFQDTLGSLPEENEAM
ncbi:hypothetical protein BofuT4_P074350.1 [Botrytis cinerea T4]|uniref:Uncharacterized protein n=1 Tax=Botryotinia fuckeliana (strain T4) TaxID=999810 RepID=G2XP27_BOTF4|nr:hypothetical protein BofuT4_P074350.1 [Botrytis cinerea T4]